jgi:hypothetical protein
MHIRMSLDGDRFSARESILLKISLENTASVAVDVPDPEDVRNPQFSYTVTGPAYPNGAAFRPRISLPNPNAPTLLKMPPGEKLEAQLALNMMFDFARPGKYTLTAHYAWNGESQNFGPISFVIEGGTLKSAWVMADNGFQRSTPVRVLGLVGDSAQLYQFFFQEQRPTVGEITLTEMIRAADAPADAQRAIAPWTNFDRSEVLFARFGWQARGVIGIESGRPEESVKIELDLDTEFIAPALMTQNGDTTLFTYTPRNLTVVRFPAPTKGASTSAPRVQWTTPVASPIQGSAAALGPAPQNLMFAVTLSQTDTGVELTLFERNGNGRGRTAELKGARILPSSRPALWVDSEGAAHAAALIAEDNSLRRVSLADVVWNSGNGSPKVDRRGVFQSAQAIRESAAAFSITPTRPPRSSWVVLLADGSLLTSLSSSEPFHTHRNPISPLQLLVLSNATYLLVSDPRDLLGFEVLH